MRLQRLQRLHVLYYLSYFRSPSLSHTLLLFYIFISSPTEHRAWRPQKACRCYHIPTCTHPWSVSYITSPFPKMARKLAQLALLFILMHSLQILALPTPYENSIAFKSIASTNTYDNRYYFPETLPDQDEIAAMLKETAMREAGFVPSSNRSPSNPNPKSKNHKMKTNTELRKSPDTDMDTAIGTVASALPQPDWHSTQNTKLRQSQSQLRLKESVVVTFASDDYQICCPLFGFFVVSAAIVCCFTVWNWIRAKWECDMWLLD